MTIPSITRLFSVLVFFLFFTLLLRAQTEAISPSNKLFKGKALTFVSVDDPNNAADVETGFGAVAESFQIGTYKVTAAQYVLFLNAVASDGDPHQLYDERMGSDPDVACIIYDATSVPHYKTISGREDFPITYVDLFCAVRFCNWLSQGCSTKTETGSYKIHHDLDAEGAMSEWIEAKANAPFFLANENQWYKAAYYHHDTGKIITYDQQNPIPSAQDQGSFSYWNYPTQSMTAPCNSRAMATSWGWVDSPIANYYYPNLSSWWGPQYTTDTWTCFYGYIHDGAYLTPVEDVSNSVGPYGTFDMGGDVDEWIFSDDAGVNPDQPLCVIRGASWQSTSQDLERHTRRFLAATTKNSTTGFRVACQEDPVAMENNNEAENNDDLTKAVIDNATAATQTYREIGETAFAFVGQEAFEMALIYEASEGFLLREYFSKMIPTGILTTFIDWGLFDFQSATLWAAQWIAHMACDSAGLAAIDYMGLQETKNFALRCGLKPVVDFYEELHEACHSILDPMKSGLNDIAEPVLGRRPFSDKCGHNHAGGSVSHEHGPNCSHGNAPSDDNASFYNNEYCQSSSQALSKKLKNKKKTNRNAMSERSEGAIPTYSNMLSVGMSSTNKVMSLNQMPTEGSCNSTPSNGGEYSNIPSMQNSEN